MAGLGQSEQTLFLVNTLQCLMAEGLADLALHAAVGPGLGTVGAGDTPIWGCVSTGSGQRRWPRPGRTG